MKAAQLVIAGLLAAVCAVMVLLTLPFAAIALEPYANLGPWLGRAAAGGVMVWSAWWMRSHRPGVRPEGRHRR